MHSRNTTGRGGRGGRIATSIPMVSLVDAAEAVGPAYVSKEIQHCLTIAVCLLKLAYAEICLSGPHINTFVAVSCTL